MPCIMNLYRPPKWALLEVTLLQVYWNLYDVLHADITRHLYVIILSIAVF
jgi:hypothetical protein